MLNKRLWYLIGATRGGINRARIIWLLRDGPRNANVLSDLLRLDYKTIRHHLDVLRNNDLVMSMGGGNGYATLYTLAPRLQTHFEEFLDIWSRIGEK